MKIPLEIPPGLASDDTTFASPRWTDGDNVRFWQGRPETIGGWVDGLNGSLLTGVCRNMLAIGNVNANSVIAFGTHTALQVWQGGALYTITPAGLTAGSIDSTPGGGGGWGSGAWDAGTWGGGALTYYARTWSLSTYGSFMIANPRGGTIYQWDGDTGAVATAITNAPAVCTYALASPQRQILAFGCNEEISADFNQLCIRGSDIEDITDWTTTPTNNAFEHVLDASAGRIVAAQFIGPYVAVWTDVSLYLGEFIGAPDQTYRFDRIGDNCGLAAANAVTVNENTAYWLAPDLQFRVWAPGGKPEIIPCPIGREFRENIDTTQLDKVCASAVSKYGEIWWHYPDLRDGNENSRYVALGLADGWFKGTLARTATINAGVLTNPVKATLGGMVYYHEFGDTAASAALNWSLLSGEMYLNQGNQAVMVRGIVPDFEGQVSDISLTLHARQYPQGATSEYGPYTLATTTLKKDFRFNARLLAVEMGGGDAGGTFMRLGKPVLDIVQTGQR